MKIGTKSVLFGAHCFFIHPWFVAWAWWKLYGFPWDLRLWVAFFVHDLGYFGKPNMDGPEGEEHPRWGAQAMGWLFDRAWFLARWLDNLFGMLPPGPHIDNWSSWTLFHSRYLAKKQGTQPSRLCVADKLAIALTPEWLYLPMVWATGEIKEYRRNAAVHHPDMPLRNISDRQWYADVQAYCRAWALEHKDGKPDTWTSKRNERGDRITKTESGVWQ